MSIQFVLLVVLVILCVFLAILAITQKRKSSSNWIFSGLTTTSAIWAIVTFFEEEKIDFSLKRLLVELDFSFALIISVFYLLFAAAIVGKKISWISTILAANLVVFILCYTPYVISGVENVDGASIKLESGPLFIVYAALLAINFLIGSYILVSNYRKSSGDMKTRLLYVMIGLIVSAVISTTTNLLIPQLFEVSSLVPRIGIYSIVIFLAMSAIAITRHGLFNVKVLAAQLFVGFLLIAILGRLLISRGTTEIVFESALLILSTVFGYFLVRSVQNEVERREEIERLAKEKTETLTELERRNKNLATLQQISEIVLNEGDTKVMAQKILDELPKQLDGCVGGLLSITKDGNLTAYAISQNSVTKRIIGLIGGKLEKYSFPIKKEFNRIHEALVDKKSIDSDTLVDFISPPIPKPVALTIQKITGARHVEVFPLYAGGEPLGVMLFVFNKDRDEIHEKNYSIAKAISDDLSLAIQRAQAFEQLKAANEYLSELDKMKDEFISMASHELNTPLAAIEGYLSMILDEGMGKIDKQSRTYLSRAYASSKRLAELILDLLNVSRIEQGRLKMKYAQASLTEMIDSVIHELQIKADAKKIYLKINIDKKLPKIWCDPDRIREVIVNLTGNAIKFTDKGGVTLKASQPDAKTLRVQVIDTGRGIAKADQNKLFQKFSQVKREVDEHQGTGLGLYISKNFVELHNGKISVESDEGKGATFTFDLPIISEPPLEVEGAMLEKPVGATRVEKDNPQTPPTVVTESTNGRM